MSVKVPSDPLDYEANTKITSCLSLFNNKHNRTAMTQNR